MWNTEKKVKGKITFEMTIICAVVVIKMLFIMRQLNSTKLIIMKAITIFNCFTKNQEYSTVKLIKTSNSGQRQIYTHILEITKRDNCSIKKCLIEMQESSLYLVRQQIKFNIFLMKSKSIFFSVKAIFLKEKSLWI